MKARISVSAVAVTVILLGFSHLADAALFMKVDNITGDSKDNLHMGWSDVSSLQLFFNSDCTGTSGGEPCSPTSMFARFAMTVDGAYTQMLQRQLSQGLTPWSRSKRSRATGALTATSSWMCRLEICR